NVASQTKLLLTENRRDPRYISDTGRRRPDPNDTPGVGKCARGIARKEGNFRLSSSGRESSVVL
ncbi:hypothetical protein AVEN_52834-1, partial [Araneus ventricosus]